MGTHICGWVGGQAGLHERRILVERKDDSVVWRGPKKNAMIRQFLSDVRWGELDYLVVDTPPGTSDEHLSIMEHLAPLQSRLSSIIVTTPQAVALTDAIKGLSFTRAVSLPVLGLIENMSGYVCPCCGEVSNVFSRGGGEEMAKREGVHFLGRLPVDTELVDLLDSPNAVSEQQPTEANESGITDGGADESFPLLRKYRRTPSYILFSAIASQVVELLVQRPPPQPIVNDETRAESVQP